MKLRLPVLWRFREGSADPRFREIRSVLRGRYENHEDGRIRAREKGDHRPRWGNLGIEDGAELTLLFGVKRTSRLYEMNPDDAWTALGRTYLVLVDMGRGVLIREEPELTVFYCRFYLTPPAVIITETVGAGLRLTAYSGGGPSGFAARIHALNKVEREAGLERPEDSAHGVHRFMDGVKAKRQKRGAGKDEESKQKDTTRGEEDEAEDISGGE